MDRWNILQKTGKYPEIRDIAGPKFIGYLIPRFSSKVLSSINQTLSTCPIWRRWKFSYRDVPPVTNKTILVLCNVVGFTVWYWMMYKVYHEFDHIVGHFTYPTPSKWTDEELGIPPDDEEE
ncbi:NADH dehydrogenase [ubiquinone] 1 beta subcomplex subunit 2, mitochondrial-like [Octopus sinensis]|uniref:NADH dehydrogenase [ubiquinone] 1 beta subcomplex subunit 2, mitochondrial-like n=1 Tax=Octopus sinensis TaxID=2607531 RepID=A0A7E6FIY6_9MOLL|nr:NADH dehydrogenase [ubiquinone] 1 beta subcomplex subunit 2, mitochondrial-like [Octopus sinensis]